MRLLLGSSWGLWVMAHLITCKPWIHHQGNWSLIQTSIQLYCLPSFYWHQTGTWLLKLIMEFPLIHISNIIPPLYPIVLFILVRYLTYRDKKNLYLWSPYSTSWNIIIFSRVKRPYWPSLHGTSSTGKHETHHEFLTVLRVIPTCWPLLPYVPNSVWSNNSRG